MSLKQRIVMCTALVFYCLGVIWLAVHPTDSITWPEWVVVAGSAAAIAGLLSYALPGVRLPGDRYCFLMTGFVGLTASLFYLIGDELAMDHEQWRTTFLLLTGVAAGYGSYLIDDGGGRAGDWP